MALSKRPGKFLTVVIRDEAPFIHMQEPVRHRTVHIELNESQLSQLALMQTGSFGKTPIFEEVSKCWIEPDSE